MSWLLLLLTRRHLRVIDKSETCFSIGESSAKEEIGLLATAVNFPAPSFVHMISLDFCRREEFVFDVYEPFGQYIIVELR